MLLSKNNQISKIEEDVRVIKFITGEEVICKFTKYDNSVTLTNPLMYVLSSKQEQHSSNVIFVPWLVGADFYEPVTIEESKILVITTPSNIAKEKYLEAIQ